MSAKRLLAALALLSLIALGGCGPKLTAVREFCTISQAATDQAAIAINHLPQSCIQTEKAEIETEGLPTNEAEKQAVVAVREKVNQDKAEKSCSDQITAAEGAKAALGIMTAYFQGLGALASDDLSQNTEKLQALKETLSEATSNGKTIFTDTAKVDAVFSVADFLISTALTSVQKKKAAEYIHESYTAVNKAMHQVSILVGTNCVAGLRNQQSDLRKKLYVQKLRDARDGDGQINAGTRFLLYQNYLTQAAPIETAIEHCRTTAAALEKARAVFTDMHEHLNDLDSEYINLRVAHFYDEVLPSLKTLDIID